jgi:hypothetical protein
MFSLIRRPPRHLPFVFVIGFNKTGTTSLHEFFRRNGFPAIHWDHGRLARRMMLNCLDDRRILDGYDHRYRVFSDMVAQTRSLRLEANACFRILDRDYPGSFFLHNTRPLEDWIRSRSAKTFGRYGGCTNLELEMQVLNTTEPQEAIDSWVRQREEHAASVRRYFSGRANFLDIDISDPELPAKLAHWLGMQLDPRHWQRIVTNRKAS